MIVKHLSPLPHLGRLAPKPGKSKLDLRLLLTNTYNEGPGSVTLLAFGSGYGAKTLILQGNAAWS
jgi:hypothetical protein